MVKRGPPKYIFWSVMDRDTPLERRCRPLRCFVSSPRKSMMGPTPGRMRRDCTQFGIAKTVPAKQHALRRPCDASACVMRLVYAGWTAAGGYNHRTHRTHGHLRVLAQGANHCLLCCLPWPHKPKMRCKMLAVEVHGDARLLFDYYYNSTL